MYLFTVDRIKEDGYDIDELYSYEGSTKLYPTLKQEAWLVWIDQRELQVRHYDLRDAPDDIHTDIS